MKKTSLIQIAILISTLVVVAVNTLAETLPLNHQTTKAISDSFPILFVPAGYVFSIWGVIYLFLVGYSIYQLLPAQRDNPRLNKVAGWVLLGSVANAAWVVLWHYNLYILNLVTILVLLVSLIFTYIGLENGRSKASTGEKWFARTTFSIYLGWVTVATVANATQVLYYLNWSGLGISPETWAIVMLAVTVLVGALMTLTRRDIPYLLVLAWAAAGIAIKQAPTPAVATAAWVATAALLALLAATFMMKAFARKPQVQKLVNASK
jgi:hypothetical protein